MDNLYWNLINFLNNCTTIYLIELVKKKKKVNLQFHQLESDLN
jgi:hypothetical protein